MKRFQVLIPIILCLAVGSIGSLFPQTTSTYRCANETCQTEKEKQIEKRMSLIKEKENALAVREEKKQQAKMEMKKAAGFME